MILVPQDAFASRAKDTEIHKGNLVEEINSMLSRKDMPADVQLELYNNLNQRLGKLKEQERQPLALPIISENVGDILPPLDRAVMGIQQRIVQRPIF